MSHVIRTVPVPGLDADLLHVLNDCSPNAVWDDTDQLERGEPPVALEVLLRLQTCPHRLGRSAASPSA
ncbi:hypothetical protein ACIBQ1_40875 [Nonomuraea sp. NPDC050153]|uniref:hypothetical protein n=1 Tax=Nonomuraea sp. NPDC050153 TaxID=3364359 RepID=UPI0037B57EB1